MHIRPNRVVCRAWLLVGLFGAVTAGGCRYMTEPVTKTEAGYTLGVGTRLTVTLKTPLSSQTNERGDLFTTKLTAPLRLDNQVVLTTQARIHGLVKRVEPYVALRQRASLLLLFDQLELADGTVLPMMASLDMRYGAQAIRIPGHANTQVQLVGQAAIVGANLETASAPTKGLGVGAAAGVGMVLLSQGRAITLPAGTELQIKLDGPVVIPQ